MLQSPICENGKTDCAKSQNPFSEIVQPSTETTTKTTTETTTEDPKGCKRISSISTPTTYQEWADLIRNSKNRPAALRKMFVVLFGECVPKDSLPEYGYIGKAAKTLGGAGRLAELMWQHSTRPPTGDILAYLIKVGKNGNRKSLRQDQSSRRRYQEYDAPEPPTAPQAPADPNQALWSQILDDLKRQMTQATFTMS